MEIFNIVTILYFLALIVSIKFNGENLRKENTDSIKGFAIMGIIMHHIAQYLSAWNLSIQIFALSGYLFTGIFLFLSGYGNSVSYTKMEDKTIKEKLIWLWKKVCNILSTYICVYIIAFAVEIIRGRDVRKSIYPVIKLALPGWVNWYIKIQLLLYVLFFLVYVWRISQKKKQIIFLVISICTMIALHNFESYWYNTILCFVFGVLIAAYRSKIFDYVHRYGLIIVGMSLVLFAVALYLSMEIIASLLFCILIIAFDNYFHPYNLFMSWMGKMTFELYLVHLVLIRMFLIQNSLITEKNLCVVLILLGSIGVSKIVNQGKIKLESFRSQIND